MNLNNEKHWRGDHFMLLSLLFIILLALHLRYILNYLFMSFLVQLCMQEGRGKKNILPILRVANLLLSQCCLTQLGVLLVMKTFEDGCYVAYKVTVFEILRN